MRSICLLGLPLVACIHSQNFLVADFCFRIDAIANTETSGLLFLIQKFSRFEVSEAAGTILSFVS